MTRLVRNLIPKILIGPLLWMLLAGSFLPGPTAAGDDREQIAGHCLVPELGMVLAGEEGLSPADAGGGLHLLAAAAAVPLRCRTLEAGVRQTATAGNRFPEPPVPGREALPRPPPA